MPCDRGQPGLDRRAWHSGPLGSGLTLTLGSRADVQAVIAASIIGFLGNEAVAIFRIRVGQEINSAALIADGYHARVDGWTSLAVLFGAVGVWLG